MAKKKTKKIAAGTSVEVNEGIAIPEFPDVCAEGWLGTVVESKGRGETLKYIIEWEDATIEAMPKSYLEQCETIGLYHRMACLNANQIKSVEE